MAVSVLSVPTYNTAWLRHPRTAPIGCQQGQVRHLCQQEQQLDAMVHLAPCPS